MNLKEAKTVLREYNKWRRGKGKKYHSPGLPFDVKKIGEAIDIASSATDFVVDSESLYVFIRVTMAMINSLDAIRKSMRVTHCDCLLVEAEISDMKTAIKSAKKIYSRLCKFEEERKIQEAECNEQAREISE